MNERKGVVLSQRLQSLVDMVTPQNRVVDVGCDHGFVSIYLVQNKISPQVLAMDVRKGPLSSAKKHVEAYGLSDYIETRLSDGLTAYCCGEGDTLICAGMGGKLMQRILVADQTKTDSFRELILQPQSELTDFRIFLRRSGYCIVEESIIFEDGKYYFPMKAVKGRKTTTEMDFPQELGDKYGAKLLQEKSPLLIQYLQDQRDAFLKIKQELLCKKGNKAMKRLEQIDEELSQLNTILQ